MIRIGLAQSVSSMDTTIFIKSESNSLNSTSNKIINSINNKKSNEEIAEDYFSLAKELIKKGEYVKAETYLNKAIQMVSGKKKQSRTADYYRELAKVQEFLKKKEEASKSYEQASGYASDQNQQKINENDAKRVKYKSNPELELQYLNQNVQILNSGNDKNEKAQTYTQIANVNASMNQTEQALENYQNALTVLDNNSDESIIIKSDMANLLAETKNYDKAIDVQKEVVDQSQKYAGVETQVQQMRKLSTLYFSGNNPLEGLNVLLDAYNLSIEKGNLKEARASLEALVDFYEKNSENKKAVKLYHDFITNLDSLIAKDSSLIDKKLFQINEDKIFRLEKEQALKDELIDKKNRYNYVLIGSVVILLALLVLIIKAWFSIRKRNKRIALQSLRREMNPHFIFNSLNSVNQFIANNNELEANKYLTSYSNLMRNMMENSNKDYVSLTVEMKQLNEYLALEKLRFTDKFEYSIEVDQNIDTDAVQVPNMIIQPNLENAIWHGLRYKESKGLLRLRFFTEEGKNVAIIDDNGIGLKESQKIKTRNQKLHNSLGLKNVEERIRLLNEIYHKNIRFEITEKTGNESGVQVRIEW